MFQLTTGTRTIRRPTSRPAISTTAASAPATPPRTLATRTVATPDENLLNVAPGVRIERKPQAWWDMPARTAAIIATLGLIVTALYSGALLTTGRQFFSSGAHASFWWMVTIYSTIMYAALVWRIVLWWRYRPMESVSDAELPKVTVIIPAFNEGALVKQSILSAGGSDYPNEKLQIVVVDDGSSDDTWQHIESAVAQLETTLNIRAIKQPRNMGKRHALHAGFKRAEGDVIVTMDSDSIFLRDSLRNAVTPLVRDPRVGCVGGCVEVLNPYDSIWTRFLKTTFTLSFKFVRAYQNQFRGVFCTPGALSVYRADVVRKVADEWLHQQFLGKPCLTGEDRAMTNLFLREGWLTAYQENAKVYAQMPESYTGMCKMLLRWARSNIRETLVLQKFLLKLRGPHAAAFKLNMLLVLSTLIIPYILIANSLVVVAMHPEYLVRHFGLISAYAITMALICYRSEKDSDAIWQLVYEVFWLFGFVWIMPYAALTLKNTGWLTRGSTAKPATPPDTAQTGLAPALQT